MITPQQGADKYKSGVQSGSSAYQTGVNNVDQAPGQLAVLQQDKMVTNWLEAVNGGKWATNVSAVTLNEWKTITASKGAQNYSASADAASQKYAQWAQTAYPIIEQIRQEVRALPSTTFAENIQRMVQNATLMSQRLG